MPDKPTFSQNKWDTIADWIKEIKGRRAAERKDLEAIWKEVDRQVAMQPLPRTVKSGEEKDWYPALETPFQFNTLEVTAADARRLKFPRGTEWYEVSAEVSDDYQRRFSERRDRFPMIGKAALPMKLDQETANVLVKTTLDHFHRLYDFRSAVDLLDAEAIKYGTSAARVRPVQLANFAGGFRGVKSESIRGPALIPSSIKNTYLDDSPHAVMAEGIRTAPMTIRNGFQHLEKLKAAARKGGKERGWMLRQLDKLDPLSGKDIHHGHVEILEAEGDIIVPTSRDAIFLTNSLVTVAVGNNAARVIRYLKNLTPFHSYVVGHYMRQDVNSPYGVSPLMKGQPVAEALTNALNDLMAAGTLNAGPPVAYDRNDATLAAKGGPEISPRTLIEADFPDRIFPQQIGDVGALLNTFLALVRMYEDLTGNTEARRGQPGRSHTTGLAREIEASQGLSRVDDFVVGTEAGPLTDVLNMEFAIIKQVMTSAQPVSVGAGGIEGWVNVAAGDLADAAVFRVVGSAGVLNERERAQNFFAAFQLHLQAAQQALGLGVRLDIPWSAIITEIYQRAGIQNASQFTGTSQALPPGAQDGSQLPGPGAVAPAAALDALATGGGV